VAKHNANLIFPRNKIHVSQKQKSCWSGVSFLFFQFFLTLQTAAAMQKPNYQAEDLRNALLEETEMIKILYPLVGKSKVYLFSTTKILL
jgi:hypothetical protein